MTPHDARWVRAMNWGARVGCHQLPARSFFVLGYQLPLCARCCGVVLGYAAALLCWIWYTLPARYALLLMLPMLVDWSLLRVGALASTNPRRLVTGTLGGFGLMFCYITFFELLLGRPIVWC